MRDMYTKYVYAVDTAQWMVIDTADDASHMKKKINVKAKKGNPYPDTVHFVVANIKSPLLQLTTDELTGYHLITNALRSGLVNGTPAETVMQRLEEAGLIKTVDCQKAKDPLYTLDI